MNYRLPIICIATAIACLAQDDQKVPPPPPLEVQLLQEAYSISVNFAPEERADILQRLAEASNGKQAQLTESWSIELLALATKQLPPGMYRSAMQKNALTSLAQVDPHRSADLFMTLEPPTAPLPNEDTRSYAARTLFLKLWEQDGPAALPRIRQLANWLGSTGQYPYSAITNIILGIAKTDEEQSQDLFAEALSYLSKDPGFLVTNRQFIVDFLLPTYKIPDKAILSSAIAQSLDAIERAEKITDRRPMRFEIMGATGKIALSSESEYLVYRLLPLVDSVDEKWAKQIREKYKGVPSSSLDSPVLATGALSATGGSSNEAVRSALDSGTLSQVSAVAKTDPAQALKLALSISDPDKRSAALASVLPAYASIDQKKSTSGIDDLAKQLDGMKSGIAKLQLMTNLINGYYALGREKDAVAMIGRAFDLGEELALRDLAANPGKMAYSAVGFDQIMGLAEAAAMHSSGTYDLLSKIRQVQSDLLRANLLSSMAKGLFSAPPSPAA